MLPISITVDVDGINLDVRVKSVEQDSTSSKVGNIEMVREALVLKALNRLLWRNNVPFARSVLQWPPSLPRRGPGFQLRILIRVCSTERLGTQLTKRYSGLGEMSSVMGTTVNWRFLQSPRDASIISPDQIFSTQLTHLVFLLSSLLFNTDSSSERCNGDDLSQRRCSPRVEHLQNQENTILELIATSTTLNFVNGVKQSTYSTIPCSCQSLSLPCR